MRFARRACGFPGIRPRLDWILEPVIGFNVAQLLKTFTGTVKRVEVDESDDRLGDEIGLVSPVRGSLRLMRTPRGILVTGKLDLDVEAACSRCLDTFVRHETIEIDEEFVPVVDVNTGVALADEEDPDAFRLTSLHELDLTEAIRQYAILESPLQELCREDCKGLCSNCGANLNLGRCGCDATSDGGPRGNLGSLLAERLRQKGFKPEEE